MPGAYDQRASRVAAGLKSGGDVSCKVSPCVDGPDAVGAHPVRLRDRAPRHAPPPPASRPNALKGAPGTTGRLDPPPLNCSLAAVLVPFCLEVHVAVEASRAVAVVGSCRWRRCAATRP
jgi:hypothetical protein